LRRAGAPSPVAAVRFALIRWLAACVLGLVGSVAVAQTFVPPKGPGSIGGIVIRKAPGTLTGAAKLVLPLGGPWGTLVGAGIQGYNMCVADTSSNPWPWCFRSKNAPSGVVGGGVEQVNPITSTETAVPRAKLVLDSNGSWVNQPTLYESQAAACTAGGGWNGNYTNCNGCANRHALFYQQGINCAACQCVNTGKQYHAVWMWPSDGTLAGGDTSQAPPSRTSTTACPAGGYTYNPSTQKCERTNAGTDDGYPAWEANTGADGWHRPTVIVDPDPFEVGQAETAIQPWEYDSTDANGNPVRVRVTPLTGGGVKIETRRQLVRDGQTITERKIAIADPNGLVTVQEEGVYTGPLTGVPDTTPGGQVVNPNTLTIPDDYSLRARQCGYPGGPPCALEPVELKTETLPSPPDYDGPKTELEDARKSWGDVIVGATDTDDKDTAWTFSFSFPTTCSAINIPFPVRSFSLDLCSLRSVSDPLVSLIWLGTAIFTCIGMIGRTLSAG